MVSYEKEEADAKTHSTPSHDESIDKGVIERGSPTPASLAKDAGNRKGLGRGIEPITPGERQMALKEALEVDPGVKSFGWIAFQVCSWPSFQVYNS